MLNTFCDPSFLSENRAVYEIMWKNVQSERTYGARTLRGEMGQHTW